MALDRAQNDHPKTMTLSLKRSADSIGIMPVDYLQVDIETPQPVPKRRHRSDIGSRTEALQIIVIHHHGKIE